MSVNQIAAIAFLILWSYCVYYEYQEHESISTSVFLGFMRAICSTFVFFAFITLLFAALGVKS